MTIEICLIPPVGRVIILGVVGAPFCQYRRIILSIGYYAESFLQNTPNGRLGENDSAAPRGRIAAGSTTGEANIGL